jgi:2-polyprenyl-6-methoxyphenol hydroxylase-like FAD-dependent oxidoreductase
MHDYPIRPRSKKDLLTASQVIVVGAGPAGLLLALMLAKKGISTRVVDAVEVLDNQPRATHYAPPAVHELHRAGVLDRIQAQGFVTRQVCWRKLSGEYIAGIDSGVLDGTLDQVWCLPLDKVSKILYTELQLQPSAEVSWKHKVVSIGQSEEKAWVEVETDAGLKKLEADYVVGCDGANSIVRRLLFGDFNFPGKTWDEQIVATNVSQSMTMPANARLWLTMSQTYYDFDKFGYSDSNFIIHPDHWHMAARISKDGLWRITYGEIPGLSREEILARQPMKFQTILPGHPGPDQYKIANISPYKVHQRLAEKMRVGRFLLAADAAHLCNPL